MSLSPISLAFKRCKNERRPALLTYTVAGDPNKKKSLNILKSISENVDLCEIGIAWCALESSMRYATAYCTQYESVIN